MHWMKENVLSVYFMYLHYSRSYNRQSFRGIRIRSNDQFTLKASVIWPGLEPRLIQNVPANSHKVYVYIQYLNALISANP